MVLAELQRSLAVSLTVGAPPPAGCDPRAVQRTRVALARKRAQAVAHLLPRLRAALGGGWSVAIRAHAATYHPCALLLHVDDAWAFAEAQRAQAAVEVRQAARVDLFALRLRWVRRRRAGLWRIRERRGFLLARAPGGGFALRLPMGRVVGV